MKIIYEKNPKNILGYLLAFAMVLFNYNPVFSQCIMSSQYGSATVPAPGAPTVTISTCNFQTEYSPLYSVVGGYTYSCENVSAGGYITITEGTPTGTVVNHGASPLTWTATTSSTHYVHWAVNSSCATAIGCNVTTVSFVSAGSVTLGCTDSTALNYNPLATVDDGSCVPIFYGCTDSTAVNYNPNVNTNDGSCLFYGCTDPTASNYNAAAVVGCDATGSTTCCTYITGCGAVTGVYMSDVIHDRATFNWDNMNSATCNVDQIRFRYREVGIPHHYPHAKKHPTTTRSRINKKSTTDR